MGNSLKLHDENYKKLSIDEMTITYNGGDYIKFVYNNRLFYKKYIIKGIKINLYDGDKLYIIHKKDSNVQKKDYVQTANFYTLDDKQLFIDILIRRTYIKKNGYYVQLEKSNN